MKRILSAALLFATLHAGAQESKLLDREFWETSPDVTLIKAELAKGFDFKEVKGMSDPVALAISTNAPAATAKLLIDQPGVDLTKLIVEGRIYLHVATNARNAEIADYLVKKGSDVSFLDANGHTALTFAAVQGNLTTDMIDVFLNNGVDLQTKYPAKDGANLLLLAVPYDKDLTITDYLVSKGLSLNSTDNNGYTAFDYAAKIGNVQLMKALAKKGIKPSPNALLLAAAGTYRTANGLDTYQYLVDELKIDPLITNKEGQNVLHAITRKQNQDDVIAYFLDKGVDAHKVDKDGNTPFMNAAGGKSLQAVEAMLPKVKNINAVNANGETALLNAVKGSTGAVVKLLLENGAAIQVQDKEGYGLAYYLIESYQPQGGGRGGRGGFGGGGGGRGGAPQNAGSGGAGRPQQQAPVQADDFGDKLKALQAKGVDLTSPQKDGSTLYHLAIAKNDLDLLKKLAPLQIDVNAKDAEGLTVLHKAAMVSRDDVLLKYLLSIGAKKEITTSFDETAYALAQENEFLTDNNVSLDFLK